MTGLKRWKLHRGVMVESTDPPYVTDYANDCDYVRLDDAQKLESRIAELKKLVSGVVLLPVSGGNLFEVYHDGEFVELEESPEFELKNAMARIGRLERLLEHAYRECGPRALGITPAGDVVLTPEELTLAQAVVERVEAGEVTP